MAKVTGPLFSLTASGNFRGLMEFRTRAGNVIAGSPKTVKPPRSPAQQAQAGRFQTAVEAWRGLPETDRIDWKTKGQVRGLSGYQLYVSEYLIQNITPPDYIHWDPVRHGYVTCPADWPHSSLHRYIRQGILPPDWGGGPVSIPDAIGHE